MRDGHDDEFTKEIEALLAPGGSHQQMAKAAQMIGPAICERLRRQGHPVCLINDYYIRNHKGKPLTTEDEAVRCLPIEHPERSAGIYFRTGDDDLLYRVAVKHGLAPGD